jgi:hypothetical protein
MEGICLFAPIGQDPTHVEVRNPNGNTQLVLLADYITQGIQPPWQTLSPCLWSTGHTSNNADD